MAIINFDMWFETVDNDYPARIKTVAEAEAKARMQCESQNGQNFIASRDSSDSRGMWLFTWHTHVGLCVRDREMNGYDDSDFYMTVYNPGKDTFEEICFASTRGWSYPSYGSRPDATPEIMAKWNAHNEAICEAAYQRRIAAEAASPCRGKVLKVVKGRKVAIGTTGECIWIGSCKFGKRVGIRDSTGTVHWTAATNVVVA